MANLNSINVGNVVNDGLGDDLRTAFQKVNANFQLLNTELTLTASNVGTTGEGIFKEKSNNDLKFKKIVGGDKIILNSTADSIVINSTQPNSFTKITTNSGFVDADDYEQITVQGGLNLTVSHVGSGVIEVDTKLDVGSILTNLDFGPIVGGYDSILNLTLAAANVDFGTVAKVGKINIDFGLLPTP